MSYHIGDLVLLTAVFRNAAGVLTDPTTVVFQYRKPAGDITTSTPTHASTGTYTLSVPIDKFGDWLWRATGSGAVQAANEGSFSVAEPTF